ncbi:MAG: hypothetical protein ACP5K7_07930 [Verrucomicrobiia bacterium]|jgi:hypothetical protein
MKHSLAGLLISTFVLFPSLLFAQNLTLGEALDNTNVIWITAYDADWFPVTSPSHDGVDAAQSGMIDDDQSTAIGAYFIGPGKLSFWWKVSSEYNADLFVFYINGESVDVISGETGWLRKEVNLPAGTNLVFWEYSKDFVLAEGLDAAWLDEVVFVPDKIEPPHLNIEKYNSGIKLFWNLQNTGFILEETDNLSNRVWSPVPINPITNLNNSVYVIIENLTAQKKFYRLKSLQ